MHRITLETEDLQVIEAITWLTGRLDAKISLKLEKMKKTIA